MHPQFPKVKAHVHQGQWAKDISNRIARSVSPNVAYIWRERASKHIIIHLDQDFEPKAAISELYAER
jgi:hypothetical protein